MKNVRNYLITGAHSHLGKGLVSFFAQQKGVRMLLTSRTPTSANDEKDSQNIRHLEGIDLLKESNLKTLAQEAERFFPGKFHVINCAGAYWDHKGFSEASLAQNRQAFEGNAQTILGVAHCLIPLMCKRGGGYFVGFSCNSVLHNYPNMLAFTASKMALESLIRSLANEYGGKGLVANCFELATILTGREKGLKPFGDHQNWLLPEEVARVVYAMTTGPFSIVNGNAIKLYHYSPSFFTKGYLERIRRK